MKRRRLLYLITVLSTFLFLLLQFFDPTIIREQLESKTFDLRLRLRNFTKQQSHPQDISIVSVDEKSIREIGRWPWKRSVLARLINEISEGRPKVIGLDIMFSEKENEESDKKLAGAIKKTGNVVLAMAFLVYKEGRENGRSDISPKEAPGFLWDSAFMEIRSVKGIPWKKWVINAVDVIPPLEEFSRGASIGHVYMHPDMDGVLRWEVMYVGYGDDCYPSFPFHVARIALGIDMKDAVLYGGSVIYLGKQFIPTDLSGRVLINYRGKEHSFPYISASDVIKGKIPAETFRDKIVLIGTSALGTYDQKVTSFSANMPGVEKNANVVENILLNNFLRKSPGIVELVIILLTGIFLGLLLPRLRAVSGAGLAIGFVGLYIFFSYYLLAYENLWINLIYPVSNMSAIFTAQTVTRFFLEEKKAREIKKMFSSYVSPKIVEELIRHPEKAKVGGQRRTITILFSDIIGFTSLSERLLPEDVVSMLNEYFEEMVNIILRWDGTLDKFVGDEIMAFWGAPAEQPDHAERAVKCALNMTNKLMEIQEKWRKEGEEILDCGIGINTGEVIVGNIGSANKKMDYTVIGDHVNIASRVEKLTRQYGAKILLTENTLNYIEPAIKEGTIWRVEIKGVAQVKVKGKEKEIRIFELKGVSHIP